MSRISSDSFSLSYEESRYREFQRDGVHDSFQNSLGQESLVLPLSDGDSVEVCIVGAGPVGAALACRLGRAGIRVALIDKADLSQMENFANDGRAYAIAAGPKVFLEEAGVWEYLPFPSCPIEDILVTDGRPGEPASPFFLQFIREDADQPFGWMVEAHALRIALNAALAATPCVSVLAPAEAHFLRKAKILRRLS